MKTPALLILFCSELLLVFLQVHEGLGEGLAGLPEELGGAVVVESLVRKSVV